METLIRLIPNLIISVGNDESLRLRQNYQLINDEWERVLKSPLGLIHHSLTIYYPIGRYDEFNPVSVVYEVTPELTAWQIIQTIRDFYKQPVTEDNIRAYMEKFPAHKAFLNRTGVTLKDLMLGAVYVKEIIPYNGGYLLKLGG